MEGVLGWIGWHQRLPAVMADSPFPKAANSGPWLGRTNGCVLQANLEHIQRQQQLQVAKEGSVGSGFLLEDSGVEESSLQVFVRVHVYVSVCVCVGMWRRRKKEEIRAGIRCSFQAGLFG